MVTRVCSIENCGRPIKARGWCEPHYTRWRAHGAPTAERAIKGAGRDFLLSLIGKHGPDCIVWPFATRADARGTLWRVEVDNMENSAGRDMGGAS